MVAGVWCLLLITLKIKLEVEIFVTFRVSIVQYRCLAQDFV